MCGFQERLFDMSMPRCVATGTAMSVSLCIVYGLSMGHSNVLSEFSPESRVSKGAIVMS